ncbi:MAG TPA: hypothetical protein VNZ22_10895, partial [Bacillota bacterium]|nr:hypothetical protein [Bacillota bacterium]
TPGSVTTPAISGSTNVSSGGTNLLASDLTTLLVNVEAALAQALPALATFNDNFDFVDVGTGTLSSGLTNSATNLATSFGQNLATNLGTNFAISSTGLSGTTSSTTNVLVVTGFGSFPITRDTLRGLLVLQNDIQRLLPLVDALNGGTNFSSTNGTVPGFGLGIINSNLAATNTLPATR